MELFSTKKVVPVLVIKKIEDALPLVTTLISGRMDCVEITMRTSCALEAIALISEKFKEIAVGAGTVLNAEQCRQAICAGAKFIVSPCFDKEVLDVCNDEKILYIPGGVTPTEIATIIKNGQSIVKFFPADAFGGLKTLKSYHSLFPSIKFMPTGGVDVNNMLEYLKCDFIVGVGGSFMTVGSESEIKAKCFEIQNKLEELK